jgi:hypothetical protein
VDFEHQTKQPHEQNSQNNEHTATRNHNNTLTHTSHRRQFMDSYQTKQTTAKRKITTKKTKMDDYYPASDPIPEPDIYAAQYSTIIEYIQGSREMRIAAKSSLKQGLWAGSGAVAGGLLFGPVGGLVGGITGSLVGFFKSNDYDGIVVQLCKLDEQQQHVLVKDVGKILITAGATAQSLSTVDAFRDALFTYASQQQVRDQLWTACLSSLHE